jgi:hypothetical protein
MGQGQLANHGSFPFDFQAARPPPRTHLTVMQRTPAAATAAATMCVLPQPGGPYSSTPVRRRRGACEWGAEGRKNSWQPTSEAPL